MNNDILDRLSDIKKIQKKVQNMNLGKCEIENISKNKVVFSVSFAEEPSDHVIVKGFSCQANKNDFLRYNKSIDCH